MGITDELLRRLETDREFRLAVAGLLGYREILERLEEHDRRFEEILREIRLIREEQAKVWREIGALREDFNQMREEQAKTWREIERLREEQARTWEEIGRLREDFNQMMREIVELRRSQRRLWDQYESFRSSVLYGFDRLRRFAGDTLEDFVRAFLSRMLAGEIPEGAELREATVRGEQINLFLEEPLIVGEVTAHAESEEELQKLLRKVRAVEEEYGRAPDRVILVVVTAPKEVARRLRRRAREEGVELILGREV